jgi:hypothetical protein
MQTPDDQGAQILPGYMRWRLEKMNKKAVEAQYHSPQAYVSKSQERTQDITSHIKMLEKISRIY